MNARIVVLAGDGIGPEVTAAAVAVLEAVAARFGHRFRLDHRPVGGAAIEAAGVPLPSATLEACRSSDAVLLGAVGGPAWDGIDPAIRPERGLLALRRELGVFANLRPARVADCLVRCSPLRPERVRGVDLLVVRELTGGIYFGEQSRRVLPSGEVEAADQCRYTIAEIERVTRRAAELARSRRGRITSVDKANVLETSRLWRETVTRVVTAEFPDLTLEHVLVDACAMHLIDDPRAFDVVLTENLFGDILTDEVAAITGSIGLLPSASLGSPGAPGLFEPIHGSAPDLAGRNVADPYGAILSAGMLLRHGLSLVSEADAVEAAVADAWERGWLPADLAPPGEAGSPTSEIGTEVARSVAGAGATAGLPR